MLYTLNQITIGLCVNNLTRKTKSNTLEIQLLSGISTNKSLSQKSINPIQQVYIQFDCSVKSAGES